MDGDNNESSIEKPSAVEPTKPVVIENEKRNDNFVVAAAEKIIQEPIPLITEKEIVPPSGDKRDFVSLSPYWYRNENGQLEVRDGEVNPETKKYHDSENLAQVENNIFITALATREVESEDEKKRFAQYAITNIKYWFVNESTRMTPSFEYAQTIQGEETGNFYGIIEGTGLENVIQGVAVLKEQGLIDDETYDGVRVWFKEYLTWLQTSKKAVGDPDATNPKERAGEKGMPNNHGTFYDVQVATIADFLGDRELVLDTLDSAKMRIESQITSEGEMPAESERQGGSAIAYEVFNLEAFAKLALLGEKYGVNLWEEEKLAKAFNYFAEELKRAGETPFKFDRKGAMYLSFRAASTAYNNQKYWDLPTKYYPDPMAEEMTVKMFKKSEAV